MPWHLPTILSKGAAVTGSSILRLPSTAALDWRCPRAARGTSGSTPDRQLQDVASAVENLVLSKIRHAMPQCMTCSLAGCLYSPFSATLLLLNPSTMNSIIFYCWWIIDFLFFILVTESKVRSYSRSCHARKLESLSCPGESYIFSFLICEPITPWVATRLYHK